MVTPDQLLRRYLTDEQRVELGLRGGFTVSITRKRWFRAPEQHRFFIQSGALYELLPDGKCKYFWCVEVEDAPYTADQMLGKKLLLEHDYARIRRTARRLDWSGTI